MKKIIIFLIILMIHNLVFSQNLMTVEPATMSCEDAQVKFTGYSASYEVELKNANKKLTFYNSGIPLVFRSTSGLLMDSGSVLKQKFLIVVLSSVSEEDNLVNLFPLGEGLLTKQMQLTLFLDENDSKNSFVTVSLENIVYTLADCKMLTNGYYDVFSQLVSN